jgi:hypothetical protein
MPTSLEPQQDTTIRWQKETSVGRRILLGEYRLFTPRFDALVTGENFLHMPADLAHRPPDDEMREHNTDVVYLESCPVANTLPRISKADDCYRYVTNHYKHYFVRIEGSFEDYMAGFNSKTRSTILRKVKRFQKLSPDAEHFKVYRSPDEMDEFIQHSRVVAEKTFQERLFGYGLPDTEEFRSQLIERARQGEVEGYVLFSGDRPVSYIHGPISHGSIILYDHVGYDPEFRKYSPGTVIQYMVIEHLFNEGRLDVYDLCTGEGEHKRLFANDYQFCADLYYFRPRPRYLIIFFTDYLFQKISRSITWTMEKLKIKSRIKRFLRSR